MTLVRPTKALQNDELETVILPDIDLYRVSRYDSGEPFFGKTGANRFDDPSLPKKNRYGVCYFGFDLETGIAETLLHDEMPTKGYFRVSATALKTRQLVTVQAKDLELVVMTGPQLKRLAGGGELSTVLPYEIPQAWSKALHAHKQNFDGVLYISRHLNDRQAVTLFERAKKKLSKPTYIQLSSAAGIGDAQLALQISLSF